MTGSSLKQFQQDTADYVLQRMYDDGPDATRRFLVADEVGMGKTLVAREVIRGAIERLQGDDAIDRIDVIYICSNSDIARQNINKLDVRGDGTSPLSTRITMLATQLRDLNESPSAGGKAVNLVAFTPGTSFEKGSTGGRVEERALLYWMLRGSFSASRRQENALRRVLDLGVAEKTWTNAVWAVAESRGEPDESITRAFLAAINGSKRSELLAELSRSVDEMTGRSYVSGDRSNRFKALVGRLRGLLADVSVDSLEPDLIILDEFQRFKHLLDSPDAGSEQEVSDLAHRMFDYPDAKVLLLSATPYKLYTLPEEGEQSGDDHYKDFISTIQFLEGGSQDSTVDLRTALNEFRAALLAGGDASQSKRDIETRLRRVMCRTERPVGNASDMLTTIAQEVPVPTPADLLGFSALSRIAREVEAQLSVEYWKSAPYFLNFMDGYQLSKRFHDRFKDRHTEAQLRESLLEDAQFFTEQDLASADGLDLANSRLRALADQTVNTGIWKLLWLPPSLPYHASSGVFAEFDGQSVTKRLIFSSWAAAPTAIAALLSDLVHKKMVGSSRSITALDRLGYDTRDGRPANMSGLALFVPTPELAKQTSVKEFARSNGAQMMSAAQLVEEMTSRVALDIPPPQKSGIGLSNDTWYWATPFQLGGVSNNIDLKEAIGLEAESHRNLGLEAHLAEADRAARHEVPLGAQPDDLAKWVAMVGAYGPANVAWRSLRRALTGQEWATEEVLVEAAAIIGAGFRSLFSRPDVVALLIDHCSEATYWKAVLEYCMSGNLQAVMDEYLHHAIGNESPGSPEQLLVLARSVRSGIAIREGTPRAFNPADPNESIAMTNLFAMRYGNARGTLATDDKGIARTGMVRDAFNSPFWPFVLASTSVGQEGIDFHWWCHSIVHWNLPSNPTDFEQREGRIHRFKGHAVRKNVAMKHRQAALEGEHEDPWVNAFAAAEKDRPEGENDLWPWWIYPGEAKIERWVAAFPLSKDKLREVSLSEQRALYRLAFGQARQEDMIEMLAHAGVAEDAGKVNELKIDLRPPRRIQT